MVSGFYGLFVTAYRRDGLLRYVSIAYREETVGVLNVKGRGYVRARTHATFLSHMQIIYSIVSPRTRTHATSQLIALSALVVSPETFSATGPLPACLSRYWPSIVLNNDSNNTCVLMASINYRPVCTCKRQPQQ